MEQVKARANEAFKAGSYSEADILYSDALAFLADIVVPTSQDSDSDPSSLTTNGHNDSSADSDTSTDVEAPPSVTAKDTPAPLLNGNAHASPVGPATADEEKSHQAAMDTSTTMEVEPTATPTPSKVVDENSPQRSKAVLLANRALARIRLEQYGFAINDANDAIALDPSYTKAFHRRATGYFALGDVKRARKDFREIVQRVPNDEDARRKLLQCTKVLREEKFARAIDAASNQDGVSGVPISQTIDVDDIVVEEGYTGPRISESGVVDDEFVKDLMEAFRQQKKLHFKYTVMIVLQAKRIFEEMPNIVDVPVPKGSQITVCGDVHGQYYDMADSIFQKNGMPSSENPYVFNGDFVDRGSFSVEVILTLLAIKVASPSAIHLTRGNHESQNMNKIYGFEGEVKAKYTKDVTFRLFTELFQSLPLAYILDGTVGGASDGRKAFIVHGGLFSKDGVTIETLQSIDRRREPDDGLMAEMLWSDPQDTNGWGPSKRGIGVAFGPDVTSRFLQLNNLDIVVRSHEMKDEGYEVSADGKLVTIFSAPNYCDQMGNKGAYIHFDHRMEPEFTQFSAVPHPDVKAMAYASGMMGLM